MWKHNTRRTIFCLCVDDFGIKCYDKEDILHLENALRPQYTAKIDWEGNNFLGFKLEWNYAAGHVTLSMPDYIANALKKLQYLQDVFPQYSPHEHHPINWTKKGETQYAREEDTSPFLSPKETLYVQSVVGTFLYYARAIDSTMLPALNQIGAQQAQPTQKIRKKLQRLLDYANTHQDTSLRFYASKMQLTVDSDAAFLVLPKARSRLAGYFRLLDPPLNRKYKHNGAILIECRAIRNVVTSAAEAETHGVYHNARVAIPLMHLLVEMGHPQLPIPIKTDNSTATGFVNGNIQLKKSKAWDMKLHWLRDPYNKQFFDVFWDKGKDNDADYFTKHHPTSHHRLHRPTYVQDSFKILQDNINLIYSNRKSRN